jgi:alkylation response protein AidB-like acyl-CoA dehydrogenase
MTTTQRTTTALHDLPELLRPVIEAHRDAAEQQGRMPDELARALRDSGVLGLYTPRELGGSEATTSGVLELLADLARIDGPTAWTVWNLNMGFLAGLLDPAAVAEVWSGGGDPLIANSGQPGALTPAEGGARLSGRWRIVSGADVAEWFSLAAVLPADAGAAGAGFGAGLQLALVPRSAVTVEQTWDVAGMRATGSQTVVVDDVLVPHTMLFGFATQNRLAGPTYRLPTVNLVYPGCAAVVIGMAQGALDEAVRVVGTKTGFDGAPLAAQERVQTAVGRASTQVAAARGLLLATARELDETAAAGRPTTDEQRGAVRGAMCLVTEVARAALTTAYELGSSEPLARSSRLGRWFRDGMAAAQSANLSTAQWSLAGRIVLGLPPAVPFV